MTPILYILACIAIAGVLFASLYDWHSTWYTIYIIFAMVVMYTIIAAIYYPAIACIPIIGLIFIALYNRYPGIIIAALINAMIAIIYYPALIVSLPLSAVLFVPFLRMNTLTKVILKVITKKNVLPQISETEEIALNAGTIWVESEFFTGKPNFARIFKESYGEISDAEHAFLNNEVEELCNLVTDTQIQELQDLPHAAWQYIREKGFFGMIIPRSYGGLEFSPLAQSKIVAKLATRSQVLSITVMVPNSLGPAELILKYGTQKQKSYYIPRLAKGDDIPCFALTEPNAGSDAASISSHGEVISGEDGRLKVRLNFEKRYITLGGVATVIGLAFKLNDPQNLLPPSVKTGITCALISGTAKGLTRGRRHKPMSVPFINSPIWGKNVIIDVEEDIIGGMGGIGNGWKMLMECLAVGRGISLPAISYGGSILSSYVALFHSSIRKQFGLPLIKFEAISEKIADMFAKTYAIDAMRTFIATAVGSGHTPSVANAIVKYHATEHSREIINHGMDILGGSAICMGEKNLLANMYLATPIGITVEGANVLTRSLLQFGQGIIRCHPYLLKEVQAIKNNDLKAFDLNLTKHIYSFVNNWVRTLALGVTRGRFSRPVQANITQKYYARLNYVSARFALLADYSLIVYGGTLKRKEFLSCRFADIASYMLLITSVLKKFASNKHDDKERPIVEYICDFYLHKIQEAFKQISDNIKRGNPISSIVKLANGFHDIKLVKKPVSQKNIDSIVRYYVENNLVSREDLFVPQNQNEQMNILYRAFVQSKAMLPIEKKIKDGGYRTIDDALKANYITQNEYDNLRAYHELCNGAVQVDHFELKSSIAA